MIRKMIGIPVSLALAIQLAGCVEEIPKDGGKHTAAEATVERVAEDVDTGPAANAPALDPDIKNPLV
jgi:hypothetical protein